MESSHHSLVGASLQLVRAIGKGTVEVVHSMGAGFAQANEGEAGLRLGGAIAMGNKSAKDVAMQSLQLPDTVPSRWARNAHSQRKDAR